MQELFEAIQQLGFPIVISAFLLYDYSRKLASMQVELQASVIVQTKTAADIHEIKKILEKLESRK